MKKKDFKKVLISFGIISLVLPLTACGKKEKVLNKIECDFGEKNTTEVIYTTECYEPPKEVVEASNEMTAEIIDKIYTFEVSTEEQKNEKTTEEFDNFNNEVNELNYFMNKHSYDEAKAIGKKYFIRMVDYIFYGTSINGQTFDELNEETKEQIINNLKITDSIVNSLEPGYKENIGEKYNIVKDFSIDKINLGKEKIKDKIGEEKYNEIIDKKEEITDKTKEKAKNTKDKTKKKLKLWYENLRNNE